MMYFFGGIANVQHEQSQLNLPWDDFWWFADPNAVMSPWHHAHPSHKTSMAMGQWKIRTLQR